MDLTVLEKMSTEALIALRDKTKEVLDKRSVGALRRGGVGFFSDQKGNRRFMRIERINDKSVSGYEVDGLHFQRLSPTGGKWRVGTGLITMMDTSPKAAPKAAPSYVPKSAPGVGAW